MAGDWIKIEHALPDKPEVMEIANALAIDADAVVGKLIRVWTWFDIHTENGNANVTMTALLDRYTGVTGFVTEMQKVGWITESNGVLTINKFERHNGQTAKNRANTNRRVAKLRKCNDDSVTNVTAKTLQKPLPEKRREEKIVVLSKDNTLPENQGKQKSELQLRVEKLMNRRPTTNMDSSESRAYKAATPVIKQTTEDDWQALEEYYRSDVSYKRMSLATLLNNWNGEIERARAHKENGGKPRQMTFGVKPLSRDDRHQNELKEEIDLSLLPVWDATKDS